MDLSLLNAAMSSLRSAKVLGQAALDLRDWNLLAVELAKMNGELLKAQQALFDHHGRMAEILEQLRLTEDDLRQAKEDLKERRRYALFELGRGQFVYRRKLVRDAAVDGEPVAVDPVHYLCQPCFDAGRKMVLRLFTDAADGPVACCPHCQVYFGAELAD